MKNSIFHPTFCRKTFMQSLTLYIFSQNVGVSAQFSAIILIIGQIFLQYFFSTKAAATQDFSCKAAVLIPGFLIL